MDRLVLVVNRERSDVYESLKHALESEADVAVVLDRRVTDRRRQSIPVPVDRRHGDRRNGLGTTTTPAPDSL